MIDCEKIDAHAHLIESIKGIGYRGEMRSLGDGWVRWANGDEMPMIPPALGNEKFTYDSLLREMDSCGVSKAVLLQGIVYGFQNEYAFEAVHAHPDRFAAMGTVDPYGLCYLDIMRRWIEDFGFRGLKFEMSTYGGFMGFHPDFQIDGDRMLPIFDYAQKNELVLSFDIGTFEDPSCQIDRLVGMAHKCDKVQFVVEHMFCPSRNRDDQVKSALERIAPEANIAVTLASLPSSSCPEEYPYPSPLRYIQAACSIIGAERIMWGSDLPITANYASYKQLVDFVSECLGLEETELKSIYAGTAKRIYKL